MRDLILLGVGMGVGYWLRGQSIERSKLRKENELLMSQLKENKKDK